jgi:hypothetical protein
MAVLEAFASECAAYGERADAVATALAKLDADRAPGATPLEFLPMCGLAALGARAAADARARPHLLPILHDCADDLRFRVRDVVPSALARVGAASGDALVPLLGEWTSGFFHAAAALRALATPDFSAQVRNTSAVILRLDEAFTLAAEANRAMQRYPGFKALIDALASAPSALAARFGVPVFDMLVRWAAAKDPLLRGVVVKNLGGTGLVGRFGAEIARVHAALDASAAPPRNPDHYVGPTRGRGRKRGGRPR